MDGENRVRRGCGQIAAAASSAAIHHRHQNHTVLTGPRQDVQYECSRGQRVTYHRINRFQQLRSGPFDARREKITSVNRTTEQHDQRCITGP